MDLFNNKKVMELQEEVSLLKNRNKLVLKKLSYAKSKKIAVFTSNQEQFNHLKTFCSKDIKEKMIRIVFPDQIRGVLFEGYMVFGNWYDNNSVSDSFDTLKIRQPELF